MGALIYGPVLMSVDGYVADERGEFGWAEPDEEVHAFVNDLQRTVGTYLYGRRMYEVMRAWDTLDDDPELGAVERDFAAVWQRADKVVYSTTLEAVTTPRTRLERRFDIEAVRAMTETSDHDLTVAGPHLAAHAIAAGLVDDYHFVIVPTAVGAGTRALPDGVRLDLELVDNRRFANGAAYLRYRRR